MSAIRIEIQPNIPRFTKKPVPERHELLEWITGYLEGTFEGPVQISIDPHLLYPSE